MTDSLQIDTVSVQFAGLRALDAVSLTLRPGEIVGLIGPNGSGKTTLINAITGYVPLAGGQIFVKGRKISGLPPHRVAHHRIRRTFQTIRLFKQLTALENVEAAAVADGHSRREASKRAHAALARLELSDRARQTAESLPYGDQRRLEIARALVTAPAFLLLDEPAAGLNESESDALLSILVEIVRADGCGLLIIDHDMRLIMRLCDRLHVLNYGRTIAEGDPASVRANPDVIAAYLGGRR
ncbi:MAG: ABC transporter ATP-binding protein [Phototrophicales bacterium]|nr:MAG: ABC transporter ATP-binding protein [Phototrophicales bacterium]